jgi:polyhydroxyalkanoate synthase
MAKQHDCASVLSAHRDPLDQAAHAALAALTGGLSPASMTLAFLDWAMHSAIAPGKWFDLSLQLFEQLSEAWSAAAPGRGQSAVDAADPRFANAGWGHWPYDLFRDGFLRAQRWWHDATTGVPGVSRHHEDIVNFAAHQWLDAWSPSNFAVLNPAVLETAVRTGGMNFAAGTRHSTGSAKEPLVQPSRPGAQHTGERMRACFRANRRAAVVALETVIEARQVEGLLRVDVLAFDACQGRDLPGRSSCICRCDVS